MSTRKNGWRPLGKVESLNAMIERHQEAMNDVLERIEQLEDERDELRAQLDHIKGIPPGCTVASWEDEANGKIRRLERECAELLKENKILRAE